MRSTLRTEPHYQSPDSQPVAPVAISVRRRKRPSTTTLTLLTIFLAVALSLGVWWLVSENNSPTESYEAELTAALAAFAVLFLGAIARERALSRALRERRHDPAGSGPHHRSAKKHRHQTAEIDHGAILNTIEHKLAEAHSNAMLPEQHLAAYHLCDEFITRANQSLARISLEPNVRNALKVRQERIRAVRKQHLLSWARGNSQELIHLAQRRARVSDRIESAMSALAVLETAIREYPQEEELQSSLVAIREYVTSVRVRYWIELAERADFKGQYARAMHRYQNALFYLGRDTPTTQSGLVMEERLRGKIESLQARLEIVNAIDDALSSGR